MSDKSKFRLYYIPHRRSDNMHTKLFIFWHKKKMAGCFDFRMRTSSFDLHQLAQRHKLAKISKLFRSKSDENVKTSSSPSPKGSGKDSPKGSPSGTPGRRRFVRVVRNEEAAGEEYENPHVIRRFTQDFLQKQWQTRSDSTEDNSALPYEVSGHTILKKHSSQDSNNDSGENTPKHASFNESVEIIEYDRKGKVETTKCMTHIERLHEDEADSMTIMYNEERYVCKDRCPMRTPEEKEAAAIAAVEEISSDMDQSLDSDSDVACACPTTVGRHHAYNISSTAMDQSLSDSELEVHSSKQDSSSSDSHPPKSASSADAICSSSSRIDQSKDTSSTSSNKDQFLQMTSEQMSTVLANKLMDVQIDRRKQQGLPTLMAES